jgi:hypothetical protein
MRCPIESREISEVLAARSAGKLDSRVDAEFEQHLAECAACRSEASAQAGLWRALDAWQPEPVSADFDRRLYQRLEAELSWWDRVTRGLRTAFAGRAIPVTAAAALMIATGLWVTQPGNPPNPAPRAQVQVNDTEQADRVLEDMEAMREFSGLLRAETPAPRM